MANNADRIAALAARQGPIFDQLCETTAKELGYGERSTLTQDEQDRIVEEVEELIENWDVADVESARVTAGLTPSTPLQVLLNE